MKTLADALAQSAVQRHLLFGAATCFTLLFTGYHVGTFDQTLLIPFLRKYADPTLYPRDPFFALNAQHFSYFWHFFLPFHQSGVLEATLFITHALATYLTFWALWRLADTLFHNSLTSLIALLSFAFPHLGFAGFPIFEFSLLNRTFVLPFLLGAITLFLQGRYLLAFALLGAMYNLHVISVHFVLAMFLLDGVIKSRAVGWRTIGASLLAFIVAALPVLLWKSKVSGPALDLSLRPEWLDIVARGSIYNLYYLFAPHPHIQLVTLSGFGALALFGIAGHSAPSREHHRSVTSFVGAALIILTVQVITAYWLPITFLIQLQIIRVGVFVLVFAYLYFAHYLAERYLSGSLRDFDFGVLTTAFALSVFAFVPVLILALQRLIISARWRRFSLPLVAGAGCLGGVAVVMYYDLWYPGLHIFPHRTPWYDAQTWARDHTPKDALFITPPHIYGFYESGWRVFSERSTVVLLSDLIDISFSPAYLEPWRLRFEALAPGALEHFRGDFFENQRITVQAFYRLSEDDLLRIAREYDADYLVLEKPRWREFPVAYENNHFIIYDLRSLTKP